MRPGDYVDAGKPLFALIDSDSFHVDGYFEETKLPRIKIGDPARVYLVGEDAVIDGHVESIASGIADRERQGSSDLLANVNPTFSWVRLAQRVPVRIALDHVPAEVRLVVAVPRLLSFCRPVELYNKWAVSVAGSRMTSAIKQKPSLWR